MDSGKSLEMPLMFKHTRVDDDDLRRLDDGQCLNENLIAYGLEHLLFSSKHGDLYKRVHLHDSSFYTKLKDSSYSGVQSWTANVDLLSYDYIVVPINEDFHWWVAIICNPRMLDPEIGDAQDVEVHRHPRIVTLDSMGSGHSQAVDHLKEYLLAEFAQRRKKNITKPPQLELKATMIPEQDNLHDSGVYLLGYMQEFFKDPDGFIESLVQGKLPAWTLNPSELRVFWRETVVGAQLDEDSRALTPKQALQVHRFCDEVRLCENDLQRYELCVQIRNDLLREHTEVQYLADICERAVFSQCARYRDWKGARGKQFARSSNLDDDDAAEWDRFLNVATAGRDERSRRLSALKSVERHWGQEIVQHYQWASKGRGYCDILCTVARQINDWKIAVRRLNLAMLKRSQLGFTLKQRPIRAAPCPIEKSDLVFLRKKPLVDERILIPMGFGFDKFGLLVHKDYAVFIRPADGLGSSNLSSELVSLREETLPAERVVVPKGSGFDEFGCLVPVQRAVFLRPDDRSGSSTMSTTLGADNPGISAALPTDLSSSLSRTSPQSTPLTSLLDDPPSPGLSSTAASGPAIEGVTEEDCQRTRNLRSRGPSYLGILDGRAVTEGATAGHQHATTSTDLQTATASEAADRASLDPIVTEVIDNFFAECTDGVESSTNSAEDAAMTLPAAHSLECANATQDVLNTSGESNQTAANTDDAVPDRSARTGLRSRLPLSYREPASRAAKPRQAQISRVNIPEMPSGCCPEVPPELRSTLTDQSLFDAEAAEKLFPFLAQLCREHLQRYAELYHAEQAQVVALARSAALVEPTDTPSEGPMHTGASPLLRRRRASVSDLTPSKRLRFETPPAVSAESNARGKRPVPDHLANDAYRRRTLAELGQATPPPGSHGMEINRLVRELLENIQHPNTDSSRGVVEALFCTGDEAARVVETQSLEDTPIITKDEQPFQWVGQGRPIEQFFRRFYISDLSVPVQVQSRPCTEQSFEMHKLGEVKERFLGQMHTSDPWNILDLQSPVESVKPRFLTGENCGLLYEVRNRILMGPAAERVTASLREWSEWKDLDQWALLSQGGHHTGLHMDSHGYATYITVQEGYVGFGWLSFPTEEERRAWMANPQSYTRGRWRYTVLGPGDTIFFGPGTIHFVFRVREHQTLALGGHVLQWSGIRRWIQVVLAELRNPAITNEEMKETAPKLVRVVAELVEAKMSEGMVQELGGEDAVRDFFESVKELETLCNPPRRRRRPLPR